MYTSLAVGKYSSTISVSFRFLHVAEESQVMNLLQKRDEWGKRCVPRLWDSLASYLDKPWVWTCCHWLGSTCMKCMPRLVSHWLLLKGAEKQSTCKLVASGSSTLYSLNHARRGWTHAILKNTIWKNLNSSLEPEKDTNLAPQTVPIWGMYRTWSQLDAVWLFTWTQVTWSWIFFHISNQ